MEPIDRARLSLDGLSVGDAFGQQFFGGEGEMLRRIENREVPEAPWYLTDDSIMAIAVVDVLGDYGGIDQDALATKFAESYQRNPSRGYGGTAHRILQALARAEPWGEVSRSLFDGMGSYGNGAAMRVAPLGAYFADDLDVLIENAIRSAAVTHAHPEAQAGAVAVALAAAWAWRTRSSKSPGRELLDFVAGHLGESETRRMISRAAALPISRPAATAAQMLGNGEKMSSQDTVPFCLWCAARHIDDFEEAIWTAASGLGDRDTTCAIAGGIVAMRADTATFPADWITRRESLEDWVAKPERWG